MGDDVAAAWFVQVDVAPDEVDTASGLLWGAGVTGIEEIDLDDGHRRLLAGCDEVGAPAVVDALGGRWTVASYAAAYDGWLDAWRPFAQSVRVGRFVIHPAWEEPDVGPGEVAVAIDAERAFGQGNHPTTRLMIAALSTRVERGDRVLDVGCGSGVLSVIAARCGAAQVVAVDIEPAAVAATAANAEHNAVAPVIDASQTPVEQVEGSFDVVVANILGPVLVELAPAVRAHLAPYGALLLGGVLEDQADEVRAAYADFEAVDEDVLDGWLSLTLVADH